MVLVRNLVVDVTPLRKTIRGTLQLLLERLFTWEGNRMFNGEEGCISVAGRGQGASAKP